MAMATATCGCILPSHRREGTPQSTSVVSSSKVASDPLYRIGVGDRLLWESPSLSVEMVVPDDGRINVEGESLRADGRTSHELVAAWGDAVGIEPRGHSVHVVETASQVIHLFGTDTGALCQPVPYVGRETVDQLLDRVHYRPRPRGFRVRVVRMGETTDAPPRIFSMQLDKNNRDRRRDDEPLLLEPNDRVYIERDVGRPGMLTRLTESQWYLTPRQWKKGKAPSGPLSPPVPSPFPVPSPLEHWSLRKFREVSAHSRISANVWTACC